MQSARIHFIVIPDGGSLGPEIRDLSGGRGSHSIRRLHPSMGATDPRPAFPELMDGSRLSSRDIRRSFGRDDSVPESAR